MSSPAHDALDRLARGPADPAPFVATVRKRLDTLTAQVEQLTRERRFERHEHQKTERRAEAAERERDEAAKRLRDAPLGGYGSHWVGCWRSHIDCAISRAESAEAEVTRLTGLLEHTTEGLREIEHWPFDVNKTAADDLLAIKERARALLAVSSRPPGDTEAKPEGFPEGEPRSAEGRAEGGEA